MNTNKTDSSITNNIESSLSNPITSAHISTELEKIMLKMIYRIAQENTHVVNNVGSAA